nr:unnamed protein product [Callosobruchus analis]
MGQPWLLVRVAALLFIVAVRYTIALSDIFEEGKSDKEILDQLLLATRYDKRLLPPVRDADFCCGLQSPEDGNGNSTVNRMQPAPPFHNGINGKQRGPSKHTLFMLMMMPTRSSTQRTYIQNKELVVFLDPNSKLNLALSP